MFWGHEKVIIARHVGWSYCGQVQLDVEVGSGRGILSVRGTIDGRELLIATSHLESPLGWKVTSSEERTAQAKKVWRPLAAARPLQAFCRSIGFDLCRGFCCRS